MSQDAIVQLWCEWAERTKVKDLVYEGDFKKGRSNFARAGPSAIAAAAAQPSERDVKVPARWIARIVAASEIGP